MSGFDSSPPDEPSEGISSGDKPRGRRRVGPKRGVVRTNEPGAASVDQGPDLVPTFEPPRQRRWLARLLGALVAVIVVVVAIGVLFLLRGKGSGSDVSFIPLSKSPTSSPSSSPSPQASSPSPQTALSSPPPTSGAPSATGPADGQRPLVTVLNGTGVPGKAASVAKVLRGRGWTIDRVGNDKRPLTRTTVYYGPGEKSDATTLAGELPGGGAVAPTTSQSSGLTVIVIGGA